jgi:hypothetical protein
MADLTIFGVFVCPTALLDVPAINEKYKNLFSNRMSGRNERERGGAGWKCRVI